MPQPDYVMRLTVPEEEELDEDIRKYLDICREKLGLAPNVLKAFTARPEKFRTFTRFYNETMLGESGLSKLEREMVAVVVSSVNRCFYCLVAHGQAVRALSGDPQLGELLVMSYRTAPVSPRQRAMLDFAWKLTETPHLVGEEDRQALMTAGLTEAEIFDLGDVIGLFNYSNRLMQALDVMPNPEYHGMDR